MIHTSPERQAIAKHQELGARLDASMPPGYLEQLAHDLRTKHGRQSAQLPPGHPAERSGQDDTYLDADGCPIYDNTPPADEDAHYRPQPNEPPAPKVHPLAQFIDYDIAGRIEPVIYVIDEVLEQAITLIAGAAGAGKTTQLVPVFARCTHLVKDTSMQPLLRRKVIYVAEDPRQVIRILASMHLSGEITCPKEEFRDWFRIVKAKRLEPVQIVRVVSEYAGLFTANVGADGITAYEAPPVVVFDTAAATFRLENENDNAQVSACISALKDYFGNIPVVIVAHTAKALKRSDVKEFSARGAGAWEADAQQVLYLTKEDQGEERFLAVQGPKHRFVTTVEGVLFNAVVQTMDSHDILGNPTRDTVIHTIPRILRADDRAQLQAARVQAMEADQELSRKAKQAELRQEILDKAQIAWLSGTPEHRSGLKSLVRGNSGVLTSIIDNLLSECWLYEVEVPKNMRTNSRRGAYLVSLSAEERDEYVNQGRLPAEKLVIPPSWKRTDAEAAMVITDSVDTVCPRLFPSVPAIPEQTETNGADGVGLMPHPSVPKQFTLRNERMGGTNGIDGQAANAATPNQDQPANPEEEF